MMANPSDPSAPLLMGPRLSRELYGGVLDYDGAGNYPGVELLNLVFGAVDGEGTLVILPSDDEVRFIRHSHDFARIMVWDENGFSTEYTPDEIFFDDHSAAAIRDMLECLQLDIPGGSRKSVTWERAHFFPYTKSLIHWDARKPRAAGRGTQIERRYLRGAGALVFKTLRRDPDQGRLSRCRNGFLELFSASEDSPLERIAARLRSIGVADTTPKSDDVESKTTVAEDHMDDILRDGVARILEHTELTTAVRVRALLRWTAFWLVLIQHRRSAAFLEVAPMNLICDCGSSYAQLRRLSQRCLKDAQALILSAVERKADSVYGTVSRSSLNKIRGFFWASAATIGLLNSWSGRRHFTLGIGLLETFVMATTAPGAEISYEEFVGARLFGELGLVVGRVAADRAGLLNSVDASVFEDNESHLATQLEAAGLLTAYSDATRMVSTGGIR